MTLNEFWNATKRNGADYDNMYGEQCVDLVNAYLDKVCGIKGACYGVDYAYQVYSQIDRTKLAKWTRVPYKKGATADYGDIIVWKKERNGYAGHIAIVKYCDSKGVTVYEQNYDGKGKSRKPTLADGGIREYTYNFDNVLGFIKIPALLKTRVGLMGSICPLVKVNATILKDTKTYKENTMQTQLGIVLKGERVRCLTNGAKISIIQYGISDNQYATGCIPSTCIKTE